MSPFSQLLKRIGPAHVQRERETPAAAHLCRIILWMNSPVAAGPPALSMVARRPQQTKGVGAPMSSSPRRERLRTLYGPIAAAESFTSFFYSDERATADDDDIVEGLFIAWDAQESDSGSSISTPNEDLILEPSSECRAAAHTAVASTKNSSTMTQGSGGEKPRFTSSSARQKHEIQTLKREVQGLSEKLQRVREAIRASWPKDQKPTSASMVLAMPAWKTVAHQQRERLQQAQKENVQLKLRALDHKRVIKSLKRALYKRITRHTVR